MKNAPMNNVNYNCDKDGAFKTLSLGEHASSPSFRFIIRESHVNGSQQFSVLQSHYIYRERMESNKKN